MFLQIFKAKNDNFLCAEHQCHNTRSCPHAMPYVIIICHDRSQKAHNEGNKMQRGKRAQDNFPKALPPIVTQAAIQAE